jgi:hypothetical protein
MNTFLATFAVNGKASDTDANNSAVSKLDFIPLAQAPNHHDFHIRTDKTQEQHRTLLTESVDPDDYTCVVRHPAPDQIRDTLQEALKWVQRG